jgi:WD40 repeat protein
MKLKLVFSTMVILAAFGSFAVLGAPPSQASGTTITMENAAQVKLIAELKGHTGPVFSVAFSPDGKLLASGGSADDHSVRLWGVAAANQRAVLEGNTKQVAAVAFNSDGTKVLSAGYDGLVRFWDATTGAPGEVLGKPEDGLFLSIQNLNTVFSADGSKIVYGTDSGRGPYLLDIASREETILGANIAGLPGDVGTIAISKDAKMLAAVGSTDGVVHLIDISKPDDERGAIKPAKESDYPGALTFSPDGKSLAISDSATSDIQVWNLETQKSSPPLTGHKKNTDGSLTVNALAFSPDGKLLASASYDKTVRIWDVTAGKEVIALDVGGGKGPTTLAWSPDGTLLASADLDGGIRVWGIPKG